MRRFRGFTILEVCTAFALVTIVLLGAWAMTRNAALAQRQLWNELSARELGTSVIERELARAEFTLTPPEGRPICVDRALAPNGIEMVLHIQSVDQDPQLVDLRLRMTWCGAPDLPSSSAVLERRTRRGRP